MAALKVAFAARDGVRLEGLLDWPSGDGQAASGVHLGKPPDVSAQNDFYRGGASDPPTHDDLRSADLADSLTRDDVRPDRPANSPAAGVTRPEEPAASPGRASPTAPPAPLPAVIITHSHSLQAGGHMYAHVLRAVAAALVQRGFAVLRFNFRGVQGSAGAFGDGRAELNDVGGAVDYLRARPRIDPANIALFGYSFGARVCLPYAAGDPAIRAVATLGMPARRFLHDPPPFQRPLLLVAGSADHVLPPEHIARFLALYPNATAHILPGADHFYRAHTAAVGAAVAAFLDDSTQRR